jgi:hypothetical protein
MPSGVPGAPSDWRLTLDDPPTRSIVSRSRNLWDFYSEQGVKVRLMDVFLKFMTADTIIFGVSIHIWILALAGVVVLWTAAIVRDL